MSTMPPDSDVTALPQHIQETFQYLIRAARCAAPRLPSFDPQLHDAIARANHLLGGPRPEPIFFAAYLNESLYGVGATIEKAIAEAGWDKYPVETAIPETVREDVVVDLTTQQRLSDKQEKILKQVRCLRMASTRMVKRFVEEGRPNLMVQPNGFGILDYNHYFDPDIPHEPL